MKALAKRFVTLEAKYSIFGCRYTRGRVVKSEFCDTITSSCEISPNPAKSILYYIFEFFIAVRSLKPNHVSSKSKRYVGLVKMTMLAPDHALFPYM